MTLPQVQITMLLVGRPAPVAVAMLSDAKGRTRTTTRDATAGDGEKRRALLAAAASSLQGLKRPAEVRIICNHRPTLALLRLAAPTSDPRFADVAQEFARAAESHQLEYQFAHGDFMGKAGKLAYAAGERVLKTRHGG